jgi:uridine kinase
LLVFYYYSQFLAPDKLNQGVEEQVILEGFVPLNDERMLQLLQKVHLLLHNA